MNGPSRRILELLSLLQSGRTWSAAALSSRLVTSPRTLRRDIERLRELGYPVASVPGPGGHYVLEAGRAMPPLILTDEESVAVVMGLRLAGLTVAAPDGGAADGALRKIEQVLPPRLRHRVESLSASTDTVARAAPALDLSTVQSLGSAAHAHLHVRFAYRNRAGSASDRRVEPYRLVLLGRRWYLLAWDLDRRDWRTFRADRLHDVVEPGTTFSPRDLPEDAAMGFVQSGARASTAGHRGAVRFDAPVGVVAERLMADAGSLEAIDDARCRYVCAADSWEWLAMTVATVGVPYSIEGPPELLAHSRALAQRIADASTGTGR